MKIVIFTSSWALYEQRKEYLVRFNYSPKQIVFADSHVFSREVIINQHLGEWLFFLDHDCVPTAESLAWLSHATQNEPDHSCVLAGLYLNPMNSNLIQRAHNFIANTWVQQSFETSATNKTFLGGVFLIFCRHKVEESEKFWGAEDKLMAHRLSSQGLQISFAPELTVGHSTSNSISHFIKRAWFHGVNDVKYMPTQLDRINILYWIRKIDFLKLGLVLLILLHFCIQRAAKLVQRILQKNKQ